ncbi:MAG: hypothetical protein J3K34DRAFT_527441 [Monoraphidium minutum]|nr:MAG: hypothetical protein J3K34DRAFT_527441 [Monoraphidium minutum]
MVRSLKARWISRHEARAPRDGVAPLPGPAGGAGAGGTAAGGGALSDLAQRQLPGLGGAAAGGETFEVSPSPFTLDGFPFGFGGVEPVDRGIDGFTYVVYDALFRNTLNTGLGVYLGAGIPNDVSLTSFLFPEVQRALSRDVVAAFGLDADEAYLRQFLQRAAADPGTSVPSGCVAPIYSLQVDGGSCEVQDDGAVECSPATVRLSSSPLTCNLLFQSAPSLAGQRFAYSRDFGEARSGFVGPPPGLYQFGATYNLTRLYLGFNAATRRVLNDFGASQWFTFLANFATANALRLRDGLRRLAVFEEPPAVTGDWPVLREGTQGGAPAAAAEQPGAGQLRDAAAAAGSGADGGGGGGLQAGGGQEGHGASSDAP